MSRFFTALAALLFALALLFFPQEGAEAARSGLLLCGGTILPALFPYFVMSNLLICGGLGDLLSRVLQPIMSPLFHVGGSGGAALALGLAGGYPTGAATVRALLEQGTCTLEEAQSLLHFCNNSGPAFILAVAGSAVFGRMELGLLLFAAHVLGALGTGLLLRRPSHPARSKAAFGGKAPLPPGSLLTASVQKALTASLQVSAYVVLFTVLIGLLRAAFPVFDTLPVPAAALLAGLIEVSTGVCTLTGSATPLSLSLCAFLLGWGGFSVHCQTAALLEGSGLRIGPYLGAKLLHGLLSAGLTLGGTLCFPSLLAAGTPGGQTSLTALFPVSIPLGWVIWTLTALFLLKRGGNADEKPV